MTVGRSLRRPTSTRRRDRSRQTAASREGKATSRSFLPLKGIHIACLKGRLDIARALLDRGADIRARDFWGRTPMHCAAGAAGGAPLVAMLLSRGADINATNADGWSPLATAAAAGRCRAVLLLLAAGADAATPDGGGLTPADRAAAVGDGVICAMLAARASGFLLVPAEKWLGDGGRDDGSNGGGGGADDGSGDDGSGGSSDGGGGGNDGIEGKCDRDGRRRRCKRKAAGWTARLTQARHLRAAGRGVLQKWQSSDRAVAQRDRGELPLPPQPQLLQQQQPSTVAAAASFVTAAAAIVATAAASAAAAAASTAAAAAAFPAPDSALISLEQGATLGRLAVGQLHLGGGAVMHVVAFC
ncbi:unnamed protein product [Phaeothamnion confervicola]